MMWILKKVSVLNNEQMRKKLLVKANGIANARKSGVISGVGRSTQKLLSALNAIDELPFDIEVYVDGTSGIGFDFYGWKFPHFVFPIPVSLGNERTSLEPWYRKHFMNYDLLHIPHNDDWVYDGERFVVTMHDAFEYDMALLQGNQKVCKKWERMALESKGIITCSEFSKSEIINRFNVNPEKIEVVYWGMDTELFHQITQKELESGLNRLNLNEPYFLSVSCAAPRKNIRMLLKAYKKFSEKEVNHRLILVWGNPPEDLLKEYGAEISKGKIVFLNSVSDEDLRVLYNGASLTLFPSRAEGFGFPVLESFACGTPVMTCRNTSLPEVGKDVAIYVGEDSIDEMVDVMRLFDKGQYNMSVFAEQASMLIKNFSWGKTAQKYVDFYVKHLY
jgi:glycosyltransferase involved in cell wall biosynthesis